MLTQLYKITNKVMDDINKNPKRTDVNNVKNMIKDRLKSYVYSELKRDPMILPVVVEV